MPRFRLTIDCDNAAFSPDRDSQIAWIMENAVARVRHEGVEYGDLHVLRDGNGNKVGTCGLLDRPDDE